jgi:hypothetical protein
MLSGRDLNSLDVGGGALRVSGRVHEAYGPCGEAGEVEPFQERMKVHAHVSASEEGVSAWKVA